MKMNDMCGEILENKLPLGVGCSCWIARLNEMKLGHIGLDSAFDLWLLGDFKLRIFRLSHGAFRTGL